MYTNLIPVVNTRNECKYCQTSNQNVFNSVTQKMNFIFQWSTADSLALSSIRLLTMQAFGISDIRNNNNNKKQEGKNKLDRAKTITKK
mgnify:CR=1 FL=1